MESTVPPLKVVEVARRLNISRAFAYKLMDSGELPYLKLGSARRVPADVIEKFVRENTISAK